MKNNKAVVIFIAILLVVFIAVFVFISGKKDQSGKIFDATVYKEDESGQAGSDAEAMTEEAKEAEEIKEEESPKGDEGGSKDKDKSSSDKDQPSSESSTEITDGLEQNELPLDPLN